MAVETKDKKLDGAGLGILWGLIKAIIPTKFSELTNDNNTVQDADYTHTDNNYTSTEKAKLRDVEDNAQENIIEQIKINNVVASVSGKTVNIPVPTDNASLANGAGYQTENDVNALIDSKLQAFIVPKGSKLFANLPTPASTNLGWMWNMSDAFTIDARFVEYEEGKTQTFPKGTNVYVVNNGTDDAPDYKFDLYQGFIDLSNYATNDDVEVLSQAEIESICTIS